MSVLNDSNSTYTHHSTVLTMGKSIHSTLRTTATTKPIPSTSIHHNATHLYKRNKRIIKKQQLMNRLKQNRLDITKQNKMKQPTGIKMNELTASLNYVTHNTPTKHTTPVTNVRDTYNHTNNNDNSAMNRSMNAAQSLGAKQRKVILLHESNKLYNVFTSNTNTTDNIIQSITRQIQQQPSSHNNHKPPVQPNQSNHKKPCRHPPTSTFNINQSTDHKSNRPNVTHKLNTTNKFVKKKKQLMRNKS